MSIETKVGIFVVIGSIFIAVLSAVFGNISFHGGGKTVYFKINDATGIRAGTPIMYRGIKVGEVEEVALQKEYISAKVVVFSGYEIPDNVIFTVKQSGFVGQKYVEFEIDPNVQAKSALLDGYEYDGKQSASSMDAVMAKLDKVAGEMELLLHSINDIVATNESKGALKDTIGNLKAITDSINSLITSNDEKFNEVIENARNMTEVIDRLLVKNEAGINRSVANIDELMQTLKQFGASVDRILQNNEGNIDDSLKNLREITDKINSAMDNIGDITRDINEGKGTLGLLINDNETKENVKNVVSGISSFFGNSKDGESGFKLYGTIGADYLFDGKSVNTGRGYAQVSLYTDPRNFYMIGVGNIPNIDPHGDFYDITGRRIKNSELAVSLQYSHIFQKIFGLRFGIFDNTLGLATDFYPLKNDNLTISLEAYDFNAYSSRFDVYTRALIKWYFYKGFFLQGGVEDIIGNTNRMYMVGTGVRFSPGDFKKTAGKDDDMQKEDDGMEEPVSEKAVLKEENNKHKDYFDSLVY